MDKFGLIGFPLSHSFSKKYFTEKFEKENIKNAGYELYELENINDFNAIIQQNPTLKGLNVTIPHKQNIIPLLDELDASAKKVNAVNVVKVLPDGKKVGYNSDYYGFKVSLEKWLSELNINKNNLKALVLGNGGASKAVQAGLNDLFIPFILISRKGGEGMIGYGDVDEKILAGHQLIINTSPLGMHPHIDESPAINYSLINQGHLLYDLVYNPAETTFMKLGESRGAKVKNGLEMLYAQAEKAWEIWES